MNTTIKSVKLLCVDDSKAALAVFQERLSAMGFEVDTVLSARGCLEKLESFRPDCILVDYEMPELKGPDLCWRIKASEAFRMIPVVILTGNDSKEHLLEAIHSGADDFIGKSVDIEIIASKIRAAVRTATFAKMSLAFERTKTAAALVATYNHEIRNPLMVALGAMGSDHASLSKDRFDRVKQSLDRIADIVKRLDEVIESKQISFEPYLEGTPMVSLQKGKSEKN